MVGLHAFYNSLFADKNRLAERNPINNSGTFAIFYVNILTLALISASTQIFSPTPSPPSRYMVENLQRATKLVLESFI